MHSASHSLNFLNFGKWLLEGSHVLNSAAQLLRVAFPVSSLLLDLGPVVTIAELAGRMFALGKISLCSVSLPFFFSFWPRLLRLPRRQQLDSCIQSENTYNSRRFKRETSPRSAAALPLSPASSFPGTRRPGPPRPAALVSSETSRSPAGNRILPEVPSRLGHGGRPDLVRGEAAPRVAVPGSPRPPRRCGSCERATPPSLLQQRLVRETRAGSVPSRSASASFVWAFTTVLVKMAV